MKPPKERLWFALLIILNALVLFAYYVHTHKVARIEAPAQSQAARKAINAGMVYLAEAQLPSGAFPIYGSQAPESVSHGRLTISPLFSTWMIWTLREVGHPLVKRLTERALVYLRNEMEPGGLWRFYGHEDPWHSASGPDLEDMAVVSAILTLYEVPFSENLNEFLPYRSAGGAFLTWQDPGLLSNRIRGFVDELKVARHIPLDDSNDVDCALNANVLFYFALRDRKDPQACAYVNESVRMRDIPRCSLYYVSPLHIFYIVTRAYRAGATCLAPSIDVIREWLPALQRPDGSWGDDLETACAVTTALQLGLNRASVDRAIAGLIAHQQPDGSWPRCRFIEANHRSEAMTTGFVMQALSIYLATSRADK